MYVCVCLAVTESEVSEAIGRGASTREAVTRACGAGGDCGACHGMIATMLEDRLSNDGTGPASLSACPCPRPAESNERLISEESLVRATRAA
jgi:bacterioferritin-associated ferredoxin